jgi:purine-binding chemotaxis protein CheW
LIVKMALKNIDMSPCIKVVVFRLREETLGFEILHIREITAMMEMTAVNDPSGFIRGVVNLHGQVKVVADLAALLGSMPMEELPKTARIIFVEFKKRVLGFIVDQVFDVIQLDEKPVKILEPEKVFLKLTEGECGQDPHH